MIAQQDLDQLLNRAKSKLVGVSQNELLAELYDVFTEFFNDSSIWWEVIKVDATPDSSTYTLTPSEGQIIRLTAVSTKDGFPWPAVMPVIPDLQLRNPPNEDTTLYAGVTVNVTLPNDKSNVPIAPSWVLPRWHTGILDGLLGKLMSIPNKSWTDKPLSGYHLKRFRDAIGRARVSALRSNTVGTQAWRFPQGAQTTTQQYGVPGFGGGERSF
jgi:hypothetical protein